MAFRPTTYPSIHLPIQQTFFQKVIRSQMFNFFPPFQFFYKIWLQMFNSFWDFIYYYYLTLNLFLYLYLIVLLIQSTSENQTSEIQTVPKSKPLLVRISSDNLRPKSERNSSDFGRLTKLDRFSYKGGHKLFYI